MQKPNYRSCILIFAAGLLTLANSSSAAPPGMVEFFDAGKLRQGLKLLDVTGEMVVLGQDGWMHSFDPRQAKHKVRPTEDVYSPVSVPELRNDLYAEYGHQFEIKSTQNFLVVQPKGRGDKWSRLFEQSHRAFIAYMSRRGVRVREGRFPMVAVVMPDEQAMYREFKRLGIHMNRVAGVYSGQCNRVITHDGGRQEFIAATVRHEAAHQSAFNSGVHSRLTDTPKWISEGVGQMFEPAGMTNKSTGASLRERINQDSLRFIKKSYEGRSDDAFATAVMELLSGDTMFDDPKKVSNAYAVSWALMFYLAEREPAVFANVLNQTAKRPPFRDYPRVERLKDIEEIIGCDTFEFSKRVSWHVHSL